MSNSVLNIPQESNLSGINRNSKRKRTIQYDTFDGVEFKETAIIPRYLRSKLVLNFLILIFY